MSALVPGKGKTSLLVTLDVEDWEHANFAQLKGQEAAIARTVKERRYAMDANTDLWIQVLAEAGATSTCFTLGEFAERYPDAVKKLASAGHEIASHCDTHELIYETTRERFREKLKRGLDTLANLTGKRAIGFRAPSWSVTNEKTPWFCEELAAQGIRYDSSEFPIQTPLYGQKSAPLKPYKVGPLLRVPVTVLTAGPARFPFASGAFFRLMPLPMIHLGLKQAAWQDRPVMIVLHPRELDPAHPRLPLKGWEAWVHYARLGTTVPKLRSVLRHFSGSSIESRLSEIEASVRPA